LANSSYRSKSLNAGEALPQSFIKVLALCRDGNAGQSICILPLRAVDKDYIALSIGTEVIKFTQAG
jgi:hypothetical protein